MVVYLNSGDRNVFQRGEYFEPLRNIAGNHNISPFHLKVIWYFLLGILINSTEYMYYLVTCLATYTCCSMTCRLIQD